MSHSLADNPIEPADNLRLRRFILALEYDGSAFNGWQRQPHGQGLGIQQLLEEALTKVMNEPIKVICAGRTDAGVHAVGQIVHFESASTRLVEQIVLGANANLPMNIRVQWAVVDESNAFHARYSATARSYRYIIYNAPMSSALFYNKSWWVGSKLNLTLMNEGAEHLIGQHDFSSFRAAQCGANSPIRTIESVDVQSSGQWIWFDIKANAFLLHMVRNIAGALVDIGKKRQSPSWIKEVLAVKDRRSVGITAPASGLYFVAAYYRDNLPPTISAPRYWM